MKQIYYKSVTQTLNYRNRKGEIKYESKFCYSKVIYIDKHEDEVITSTQFNLSDEDCYTWHKKKYITDWHQDNFWETPIKADSFISLMTITRFTKMEYNNTLTWLMDKLSADDMVEYLNETK